MQEFTNGQEVERYGVMCWIEGELDGETGPVPCKFLCYFKGESDERCAVLLENGQVRSSDIRHIRPVRRTREGRYVHWAYLKGQNYRDGVAVETMHPRWMPCKSGDNPGYWTWEPTEYHFDGEVSDVRLNGCPVHRTVQEIAADFARRYYESGNLTPVRQISDAIREYAREHHGVEIDGE